jgi:hypothetical protein
MQLYLKIPFPFKANSLSLQGEEKQKHTSPHSSPTTQQICSSPIITHFADKYCLFA